MTFILCAEKNKLVVRKRGLVTSGSVNVYPVRFDFSTDWEGLSRTAVFQADGEPVSVLLDGANECGVPWEALVRPGIHLRAGVYGAKGGEIVLPTIWADLGEILQGVTTGQDAQPPTPELWEQALAGKGDRLSYDGLNLSLLAGDKPLSSVQIVGGGGDGEYAPVPGPQGPEGPPGPAGPKGEKGETGPAGSDATITAGDGLTKEGGTISVDTPVRGVMTQAEYDALPEEQRNKGLYMIPGEGGGSSGGVSMEQVNEAVAAALAVYRPLEVYSAEETRIGTWVDGKPLYQKAFEGTTASAVKEWAEVGEIPDVDSVVSMLGVIQYKTTPQKEYAQSPGSHSNIWLYGGKVQIWVNDGTLVSAPCHVICRYTKKSDEAEVDA